MRLTTASWVLAGGFLLHNADHARRGLDLVRDGVIWGGTIAAMLIAVLFTLVWVRHPSAPAVAAAVGFGLAVGVSAVHLLPDWFGTLSDSLPDGEVDALTWLAVLAEIGGAALVGVVAMGILRDNAYASRIPNWA